MTKETSSEATPVLNRVHMITGAMPKTEPTERSNSPEVMSSVMPRAMRPSSTVKLSVLLMLRGERKSWLIDQNAMSSTIRRTRGPNSGRAMKR